MAAQLQRIGGEDVDGEEGEASPIPPDEGDENN